ncbi:MAG: acyl carrier protein [Bacteroidetes bacterium]|nr:MAG: acyl carrier protein [Bacteroidota bacterium]
MKSSQVIEKISEFLVEEFEVDKDRISPEANLKDTLDLDSLDYVDLVVIIEDRFGFKVKGEDFMNILTFQDFYDYIIGKLADKEKMV